MTIRGRVQRLVLADELLFDGLAGLGGLAGWRAGRRWQNGVMTIRIKRVYEHPQSDDGYRVLADRSWPRGVAKADAAVNHAAVLLLGYLTS
ncbi:MAG: DUF488 family protein, N3 subclade [Lacisediminihabitans sp.]